MSERRRRTIVRWMWVVGGGAACLVMPNQVRAGEWSFFLGLSAAPRHVPTVAVEPVTEWRTRRVWVEPEYVERTVEVHVPAVIETRRVAVYDHHGRIVGHRLARQIVEPAHIELRTERVKVCDGYYKTVREEVHVAPVVETVIHTARPASVLHLDIGHRVRPRHHEPRRLRVSARPHEKHRKAGVRKSRKR